MPIGATIAKVLEVPLDIILTKKIGHPYNPEYAIGAISLDRIVLDEGAENVPKNYINEQTIKLRALLQKRYNSYYQNKVQQTLANKIVILTDDGIATGNTILASILLIAKEKPSKIIVAVPVSSVSAFNRIIQSPYVDNLIALELPNEFYAVGEYYKDFSPVEDDQAIALFNQFSK